MIKTTGLCGEDILSRPALDSGWCSVLAEPQTKFQAVHLGGKPDCNTTASLPCRAQKEKLVTDTAEKNLTY